MAPLRLGPGPPFPRVEVGDQRTERRGDQTPDAGGPTSGPARARAAGLRQGARARAEAALYWRRAPLSMVLGRGGAEARSREGACPAGGGATRGAGSARPAGWGWLGEGQLPGAAGEDVATAPRYPSAPESRPRRSLETPSLRRPPPNPGPTPPLPGAGRAGGRGRFYHVGKLLQLVLRGWTA